MVFLNPSILFGLFAASIPILIHLINLRKLQKVEFSTLAFLKELQKSKIKKIKIKQWIILLLRTLIIIFLVLSFARPALESVTLIGSTASAKSSSVFIIDNSFSMNYVGREGTLFNESKKITKEIISEMRENDEFLFLISADSIIKVSSRSSALDILKDLTTTTKSELLTKKLIKAMSVLEESQNINKEIYLFSDFQKSTFSPDISLDSLWDGTSHEGILLYSFDLSVDNASNISISDLVLENSIIEMNKQLTFSATINNFTNSYANELRASLFLNDKRVAQENVSIEKGGNKIVTFKAHLNKGGINQAKVELEDDNILLDNTAYLSFYTPEEIKLLILYEEISDIYFLETALNSLSGSTHIHLTKHSSKNILNYSLSDFDLIIWIGTDIDKISELRDYISNGGNLFYLPPSAVTNNILNPLTEFIKLPGVNKIVSTDRNSMNYSEFKKIELQHPIFLSLFEDLSKKEIESPDIFRYIKFKERGDIRSIIRLIDGSVFLGEYDINDGRVIFINTSPNLNWSNFPIKGIFAPLISRIVFYLSTNESINTTYYAGDRITIDISKTYFPIIDVELPQGTDKIYIDENKRDKITYNNTDQLGNYIFSSNNKVIYYSSVNSSPMESDLTKLDHEFNIEIHDKLFGNNYFILRPDENYIEKINFARFGTELWSYLLAIAFMIALIEMYVARSSKRDLMDIN